MFKLDSESTDLTNNIFPSCLTFKISFPPLEWGWAEFELWHLVAYNISSQSGEQMRRGGKFPSELIIYTGKSRKPSIELELNQR